jgi:hypothetical protein
VKRMQDITSAKECVKIPLRARSEDGADPHKALERLVETFTYSSCHVLPAGVRNLLQDAEDGDGTNDGCDCRLAQCGTADADCDCIDEHGRRRAADSSIPRKADLAAGA